jgi:sensor c-di-GMP phosphodiesterase-like protein
LNYISAIFIIVGDFLYTESIGIGDNMHFNRKSVICFSIFLFIVCMTIPILIALYLSWIQAKDIEYEQLFTTAKSVVQRSRICLNEIYQTFDELETYVDTPCTRQHLQAIQDRLFNNRCIIEIEYIDNNKIKCSSAGKAKYDAKLSNDGFKMPNGTTISFDTTNFVKQNSNLIRFKNQKYAISVDKNSLTDIMTEPYIKIAIVTEDGKVISTLNHYSPNPDLINAVLSQPNLKETDDSLVAVYRTPGLYYVISEPLSYAFKQWHTNLLLFLPFGIIMSLIACGTVLWGLRRRLSFLGELKIAVARHEFIVYYQPIIEFKSGVCIGAEALVRWKKPDGTMVRPDLFIPLAESSGLIQDITDQMIDSVVANMKNILCADRNLHISINVSVVDFNSERIFKKLETTIKGTGIEPQQLWLEITERGFIDFEATRNSLQDAHKVGYVIVMDDFGTGYSSLSYLKELPIDVLKIDKYFIGSLNTDSVTSNVTEHIINLAKELNLKIIAEGVETPEQADYLKKRQVDFAQGWLYSKALPLNEFIDFYKKSRLGK